MHRILIHVSFAVATVLLLSACGGARAPGSGSGNISISWQPPTTYQDSSPLQPSDIGGYRIHVGTSEENMRLTANIADPSITEYRLDGLGQGIHYIAVSCYNIYGEESLLTLAIMVDIL